MKKFLVTQEYNLAEVETNFYLHTSHLLFLTGKNINWIIRQNRHIYMVKDRGHLRIYDDAFIIGETYKHRSGIYDCATLDDTGIALMNKRGSNLTIKTVSLEPLVDYWEII